MPPPLAMVGFDGAVNSGVHQSVRWLQSACNTMAGASLAIDGDLGPMTLAALLEGNAVQMAQEALVQRLMFLTRLPTFQTFGLGWTRRVLALLAAVV